MEKELKSQEKTLSEDVGNLNKKVCSFLFVFVAPGVDDL
jgi:hypothetical protein